MTHPDHIRVDIEYCQFIHGLSSESFALMTTTPPTFRSLAAGDSHVSPIYTRLTAPQLIASSLYAVRFGPPFQKILIGKLVVATELQQFCGAMAIDTFPAVTADAISHVSNSSRHFPNRSLTSYPPACVLGDRDANHGNLEVPC